MKIKQYILILILGLSALIRFINLGSNPQGFFSDEAAVGYNAYSLLNTGKDEFGQKWPFFFRSFGEGKLPLYIYQDIPFMLLLGPTKLAVRFPGAFFGSLTIFVWYLFLLQAFKLSKLNEKLHQSIALVSGLILGLMPWHIHFSRGVFGQEAVFWLILGSYLLLKGLFSSNNLLIFLSYLANSTSLLIYHSPKAILPFWLPLILIIYFRSHPSRFSQIIKANLFGVVAVMAVWGIVTFSQLGMARTKGVSVFSVHSGVFPKLLESITEEGKLYRPVLFTRLFHNKVESFGRDIIGRYLSHFNPDWLFISGDTLRPRYQVPGQPQVFILFLPFCLIGLYFAIKFKLWLPLILLALAPLPAALSFETPSSVRALTMTPGLAFLISLGLIQAYRWLKSKSKLFFFTSIVIFIITFTYQLTSYLNAYFFLNNIHKPYEWQYPYQPLVAAINDLQSNYDHIVITGMDGPPYIFFLFYNLYNPLKYHAQVNQFIGPTDSFGFIHMEGYDKYRFPKVPCPFNASAVKTLFVCKGDGEGIDRRYLIKIIYYADKTPAFSIFDPTHKQ